MLFVRDQSDPVHWFQDKRHRRSTIPAEPKMHGFALWFFVKRRRCGIVRGHRNRDHLELKQSALGERVQRAVATLVNAVPQHAVRRP